ncbi:MAG TPA: hypothetical protein VFC78_13705 [Tepidisphaeraceae bacterium]|nr:hypothetical protein [Tepidisphaeraceae bacterium]
MPAARRPEVKQPVVADMEPLLSRWPAKERARVEKHLALCDAEGAGERGRLWRRLAAACGALAPLPPQTLGNLAVMFFIPDGKYRMQVFTLEDVGEGEMSVFLPDVLTEALRKKVLGKSKTPGEYAVPGSAGKMLAIESLDASNTPSPQPQVKNLIGWNRKAIRVKFPVLSTENAQITAAEGLFELAAKKWATPTP